MKKKNEDIIPVLSEQTEFKVRFNEADPLGIVWHGNYLKYFEDGREAFGAKYGLAYMDIFNSGFVVPVVSIKCDYKKSLYYSETAIVETTLEHTPAAKIIFRYRIFTQNTRQIVAEGLSVQIFMDRHTKELQLSTPPFFEEWKKKHGLS